MAAAVGLGPAGTAAHIPDPHILLTALQSNMAYFLLPHLTSSYIRPPGGDDSKTVLGKKKNQEEQEEFLDPKVAAVKHGHVFSTDLFQG